MIKDRGVFPFALKLTTIPKIAKPTAAQTGNAGLNGLLAGIGAGKQMNNINIDGILDAIKQNWYLVAGGILVIAILTR